MRSSQFPSHGALTVQLRRTTIDRFVAKVGAGLPVHIGAWKASLAILLVIEHADKCISRSASAIRDALKVRNPGDVQAKMILDAVDDSSANHEYKEVLGSAHLALLAFACRVAESPAIVFGALERFAWLSRAKISPFPAPVTYHGGHGDQLAKRNMGTGTLVHLAVDKVMHKVVRRAATVAIDPFRDWSWDDRGAALHALWLSYTATDRGSAQGRVLLAEELHADLLQCGVKLWRQLIHHDEPSADAKEFAKTWSALEIARLRVRLRESSPFGSMSDDTQAAEQALEVDDAGSGPMHVVCKNPIARSTEKYDRDEIERHLILEKPLPTKAMPSAEELRSCWQVLEDEFPWAGTVLQIIFEDLIGCANLGAATLTLPATLLVGTAGSGKSRLARRIAEELNMIRLDVGLGGGSDSKALSGTSRGWASGQPSEIARLLASRKTASAIVLLDEVDKARSSTTNDSGILSYLLGLLEPETARRHFDTFLKTECDFSEVSWLATANSLSPLGAPLKSRLRILHVPQPSSEHFVQIAQNVIGERAARLGVHRDVLPSLEDLDVPIADLSSARQIRVAVEAGLSAWSCRIVRH